MRHFRIKDFKDLTLADNLLENCKKCLEQCSQKGTMVEICPVYDDKRRQGFQGTKKGSIFLCDTTKTTKLFRDKLEALSYSLPDLIIQKKEIEEEIKKTEQQKVNRLVHNLTSINAHNIQEIYDLVPQEVLSLNWKNQVDYIEREIIKNPHKTAMMFLRIAKHNIHMKSEFSIYKKLDRGDNVTTLDSRNYPIRNVLLNVLHTFFADFSNNSIYVEVEDFYEKVKIDYETIQVAIYHLIENASKYTLHDSKVNIKFEDIGSMITAKFIMNSLYIEPSERESIFAEGFSGKNAKKCGKNGDGIGMWRIKQMMQLNGGGISVNCGEKTESIMGVDYAQNIFILTFRKA